MDNFHLHFLNASNDFDAETIEKIEQETFKSLNQIHNFLPAINVDIVFQHAPTATITDEYIGGRCTNSSTIFIYFDTHHSEFDRIIQNELKKTLAHEYHHASRWKSVGYGKNLRETMITEGLADHFSIEVFKTNIPKWCLALKDNEIQTLLDKASNELNNKNYDHFAWFFGTTKHIPKWAGYSLGYFLVQEYLNKNSNASASKLVDINADIILNGQI